MDSELNTKLTHYIRFTYLYFLIRFKLHYRHVSIITHNDFDGMISAAIVLQKIPYSRIYFATPRNLYKLLYIVKNKVSKVIPHLIYILDLSVPKEYLTRVIRSIQNIRRDALIEINWIDHHQSKCWDKLADYVNLFTDPTALHAAYLVQKYINNDPKTNRILDLLKNSDTLFVDYWKPVLKAATRAIDNNNLRTTVLRNLAKFTRTEFTDMLSERGHQYNPPTPDKEFKLVIAWTNRQYRFGFIEFKKDITNLKYEIYRKIDLHGLDFLLVRYNDGTLSAYKARHSTIDLMPLFDLVKGNGHSYAFHFDPQERINDKIYRPLSIPDLIEKVQEVL